MVGGSEVSVDKHNVGDYIKAVVHATLHEGIKAQMQAFRYTAMRVLAPEFYGTPTNKAPQTGLSTFTISTCKKVAWVTLSQSYISSCLLCRWTGALLCQSVWQQLL